MVIPEHDPANEETARDRVTFLGAREECHERGMREDTAPIFSVHGDGRERRARPAESVERPQNVVHVVGLPGK
jgi:hypothetical protein